MAEYDLFQYIDFPEDDLDTYPHASNAAMSGNSSQTLDPPRTFSHPLDDSGSGCNLGPALGSSQAVFDSFAGDVTTGFYDYPDTSGFPAMHGSQGPFYRPISGSFDEDTAPSMHGFSADTRGVSAALGTQCPIDAETNDNFSDGTTVSTSHSLVPSFHTHYQTPLSQTESAAAIPPVLTGSAAISSDTIDKFCERTPTETRREYGSRLLSSLQVGRGVLVQKRVRMEISEERYWTMMKQFLHKVWSVDALASDEVWGLSGESGKVRGFRLEPYPWDIINAQSEQWSAKAGRQGAHQPVDIHLITAVQAVREEGLVGDRATVIASSRARAARSRVKRKEEMTASEREEWRLKQNIYARRHRANETPEAGEARRSRDNARRRERRRNTAHSEPTQDKIN